MLSISVVCLLAVYCSLFFSQEANAQHITYSASTNHGANCYNDYAMGRRTVSMPTRSTHPYYRKITTDEYYKKYKNANRGRRIYRSYVPVNNKRYRKNAKRQNPYFRRSRSNPFFSRY